MTNAEKIEAKAIAHMSLQHMVSCRAATTLFTAEKILQQLFDAALEQVGKDGTVQDKAAKVMIDLFASNDLPPWH